MTEKSIEEIINGLEKRVSRLEKLILLAIATNLPQLVKILLGV